MREDLGLPGESVFFEFLLATLTQKNERERLLMSECANVRSWPVSACHDIVLLTS